MPRHATPRRALPCCTYVPRGQRPSVQQLHPLSCCLRRWAVIGAAVIPDPQLSQALPGGSSRSGSTSGKAEDKLD